MFIIGIERVLGVSQEVLFCLRFEKGRNVHDFKYVRTNYERLTNAYA